MLKTLVSDKEDMGEKIGRMRHHFLKEMEELLIEVSIASVFGWLSI